MAINEEARSKAWVQNLTIPPIDIRTSPREMLDERTKGSESLGLGQQIIPVASTLRSAATEGLGNLLGGGRERYQSAQNVMSLLDALPYAGGMLMADDVNTEYQQGNYKTAAALGALGAIPFVGPFARLGKGMLQPFKNVINSTALNTPTNVRGGIIGDALDKTPTLQKAMGIATDKKVPLASGREAGAGLPYYTPALTPVSMLGESATAFAKTLKSKLTPKDVAFERQVGMPAEKLKEIASGAEGSAETAELMMRQLGMDTSPLGVVSNKTYLEQGINAADVDAIADAVGNKFVRANTPNPVPDKVSRRYAPHIQAQVGSKGTVSIKNPARIGSAEAAGQASVAPNTMKALQGNSRKAHLATLNARDGTKLTQLTPQQTVEFLQVSGAIDVHMFRKHFKKSFENPTSAVTTLLRARHKLQNGGVIGKGEQKALDAFNKLPVNKKTGMRVAAVRDDMGNLLSADSIADIKQVPDESFLTMQQTFNSSQKELGGANAFISVDPYNQRAYVGISDKHDIGGINPLGGENIITAQPLVSVDYASGTYGKGAGLADSSTYKGTTQAQKEGAAALKKVTGVTKKPSETGRQYLRRAVDTADIRVTKDDQLKIAGRVGKLGAGGLLTGAAVSSARDREKE